MVRSASAGLSLVVAVQGSLLPGEKDWSSYTYDAFLKDFGASHSKSFSLESKAKFEATLERINAHNAREDKTWYAGVNQFTDMSTEEFSAYVKGRTPPPKRSHRHTAVSSVVGDLPKSVDWRQTANVVSAVKNQESCGSCWAFSAVSTFESHLALATGEPVQELSPQQIVSCSPNPNHCGGTGGCDGSTQPLAFNYTQTAGLTTERYYQYNAETGTCDSSKIFPVGINEGYEELPTNDYDALMSAVATKGPISISVAASSSNWQMYHGGVMSDCKDYVMDHAVQLVGYGSNGGFLAPDYWLVRNSWGEYWGEDGYVRIKRHGSGKEPCGKDIRPEDGDACDGDTEPREYCGECAILSASSYPTGLKKIDPPPGPAPPAPIPQDCGEREQTQEGCEVDDTCEWCYYDILDMHMCTSKGFCNGAVV